MVGCQTYKLSTEVGTGKSLTAEMCAGFGLIPSGVITWPKYLMSWRMKWHFDGLNFGPVSASIELPGGGDENGHRNSPNKIRISSK